jgi:hypothetical protein
LVEIEPKYVADVPVCNKVPPVSALYHLKIGAEVPLVLATVQVGIVGLLHSVTDVVDGAVGVVLILKLTGAVVTHPVVVLVACT